jgi:hypothetical protein
VSLLSGLQKAASGKDYALPDDDVLAPARPRSAPISVGHHATAAFAFLGVSLDNWLLRFRVQAAKGKHCRGKFRARKQATAFYCLDSRNHLQ